MAQHQVLFCPFCRESFERQSHCPEHELSLISFEQLPHDPLAAEHDDDELEAPAAALASVPPRALAPEDRALGMLELRFGRGLVALGALLDLVALALPLRAGAEAASVYQLTHVVPSLWTLMLVSFTLLFALQRRRTLRRLRSLRVLVPLLALLSPLSLAWAMLRIVGLTGSAELAPGSAVYVVVGASLCTLVGGLRLGVSREGPV